MVSEQKNILDCSIPVSEVLSNVKPIYNAHGLIPFSRIPIGDVVYAVPWVVEGDFEVAYNPGGTRCMKIRKTAFNKFVFVGFIEKDGMYRVSYPFIEGREYRIDL